MPHYYFNTDDGSTVFDDAEGTDLPTVEDVEREAMGLLRDLLVADAPLEPRTIVVTVCDVTCAVVLRVTVTVTSNLFVR